MSGHLIACSTAGGLRHSNTYVATVFRPAMVPKYVAGAPARTRAPRQSRERLEREPPRELERARSAGPERLPHALVRLPERAWHEQVVVEVGEVRGVED